MNTLKDYVNWKLTHADKVAEAEGYPLVMENCKKNKRMKQLEIYGNSVQDGTPSPENPIEVQSVGELTTKNLAKDVKAIYSAMDKYEEISEDNRECVRFTSANSVYYTGIEFKDNTQYTISFDCKVVEKFSNTSTLDMGLAIFYTDGTKKGVFGKKDGIWKNINITSEAGKTIESIGIYSYNYRNWIYVDINTFQIEEGSTVTPYEPYGKYKASIVQKGINLFSMAKAGLEPQTINGITFTPLDDERIHIKGKAIDTSIATTYNPYFKTNIPIKAGVYNVKSNNYTYKGLTIMFAAYKGGKWLINFNAVNTNQSIVEDGNLTLIHLGISAGNTREWDDIVELQLTSGKDTKSLPYEPYVEPITTNVFLNEPLRKIGDYADYIDSKNKKVNRLLHEYYIDGSQTVTKYNDTICMVNGKVRCRHTYSTGLSNRFPNANYGEVNKVPYIGMANAVGYNIQITNYKQLDGVTDNVSLKEWFKTHHTTYIQPLETPKEEPLNIDLPKLNAKTTIIEVDTSLEPSNAKGKYIKK